LFDWLATKQWLATNKLKEAAQEVQTIVQSVGWKQQQQNCGGGSNDDLDGRLATKKRKRLTVLEPLWSIKKVVSLSQKKNQVEIRSCLSDLRSLNSTSEHSKY